MTDAASTVTPPAQAAAPSVAKTPARQAEPKGPTPKVMSPPKRPVSPPKASPAKAKGPIDIRSVPKAPVRAARQLSRRIPALPRVHLPLGRQISAVPGEVCRFPSLPTRQRPPDGGGHCPSLC